MPSRISRHAAIIGILAFTVAAAAPAKTLRWSAQGNYLTTDPHAVNVVTTNMNNLQVYESLLLRDKAFRLVPGLATSWRRISPTVWIFDLRKGVKWHDGSDFTADDVVFSIERVRGPTSGFRNVAPLLGSARKIDDYTVEFTTASPNPVLPDSAAGLAIMSKAWCEKHGVAQVQDYAKKEDSYAARHAMGTGSFILVSHEPDVKSVFRKNPNWWGLKEGLFDGNVTETVFTPIASDATRMAALSSGAIDFVIDPPLQDIARTRQDPQLRVHDGVEATVFFIAMDQHRGELLYSSVKGRNPFKDVRVRRAINRAIDMDAIVRTSLRGLGLPTGIVLPNPDPVRPPKELAAREPPDIALAKRLMAEAGYANGFAVTADCDARWERLCGALAGMLARIGITVNVTVAPAAQFYAKIGRLDTSMYVGGWVSATDPIFTLQPLFHSRNSDGDGHWNYGNFKDERLDALIQAMRVEFDEGKRRAATLEAVRIVRDEAYLIALYRRVAPWASRRNIEAVFQPNTFLVPRWVVIGGK